MGRKHDMKVEVKAPLQTNTPTPKAAVINCDRVMDRRGCVYVWKPNAKPPYAKHSIHYPTTCAIGDEDIPIQNNRESKINGASPELLLVAAFRDMKNNSKTDPAVLYHLDRAIGRLLQTGVLENVS